MRAAPPNRWTPHGSSSRSAESAVRSSRSAIRSATRPSFGSREHTERVGTGPVRLPLPSLALGILAAPKHHFARRSRCEAKVVAGVLDEQPARLVKLGHERVALLFDAELSGVADGAVPGGRLPEKRVLWLLGSDVSQPPLSHLPLAPTVTRAENRAAFPRQTVHRQASVGTGRIHPLTAIPGASLRTSSDDREALGRWLRGHRVRPWRRAWWRVGRHKGAVWPPRAPEAAPRLCIGARLWICPHGPW
mmetsp:Transcript_71655/g.159359  ORF Transcript_71655/g.159359 Transcript_71655/m.159359 type:complete len:248 (+) Transcript_71655:381-1124(+)